MTVDKQTILTYLKEAKLAIYQYEQTLLADGRNEAAKIYTEKYYRFGDFIQVLDNTEFSEIMR